MFLLKKLDYKEITYFLWMISIFLFCMGFARQLHYFFAPFVCFLALAVIFQNQTISVGMVRLMLLLLVIVLVTSYHYFFYSNPYCNFLEFICYPSSVLLSSYAMYSYVHHYGDSALKQIRIFFIVFFVVGIYRYIRSETILSIAHLSGVQNNYFYFVLMPLPILLIKKQSFLNGVFLVAAILICILSMKRSAIIAISLISASYILHLLIFESITKKMFFIFLSLIIAFFLVSDKYVIDRFERSVNRFEKIDSDRGSGRGDIIVRFGDDDFYDVTTFPEIFIGNGFASYANKYENKLAATHNDFLEVLYSYGFCGIIIYVFFIIQLFKTCINLLKIKNPLFLSSEICLILFVVYGLFANNFYFFFYSIPLFLMVGILDCAGKRTLLCKK